MDRVQLRNFVLLAQTLNFSAAAKQAFISQPAMTKQISRLEEELGVRLFHRTKHGVWLTFAGEEFYKDAIGILEGMEKAEHHMDSIRHGQTGSLEISALFGLDKLVAGMVKEFLDSYPEISVNITASTGSQQVLSINSQAADVYFSSTQLTDLYPNLETLPLPTDRFAIYLPEDKVAQVQEKGLGSLEELPHLIEYRSESGPLFTGTVLTIREAMGLRSGNIAYYPSNTTILIAVRAGMGFAMLPSEMNFGLCPEGVAKLPLDLPEARIGRTLAWSRTSRNPAALRFAKLVGRHFGQDVPAG